MNSFEKKFSPFSLKPWISTRQSFLDMVTSQFALKPIPPWVFGVTFSVNVILVYNPSPASAAPSSASRSLRSRSGAVFRREEGVEHAGLRETDRRLREQVPAEPLGPQRMPALDQHTVGHREFLVDQTASTAAIRIGELQFDIALRQEQRGEPRLVQELHDIPAVMVPAGTLEEENAVVGQKLA